MVERSIANLARRFRGLCCATWDRIQGSVWVAGAPHGLQIRWRALNRSVVGSIPTRSPQYRFPASSIFFLSDSINSPYCPWNRVVRGFSFISITKHDVLRVLEPIWHTRPETAKRIRWRIRAVLRYCQAHDYVEGNVADERINGALPKNPTVKKNLRAMPYQEMPRVLKLIDEKLQSVPGRLCLKWIILTAARSGEARGARWSEIDLVNNIWTVPGERMKGGKPHRVPLSTAVLDVLEEAKSTRDRFSDLLFPSPVKRGYPLSDMTLMMNLRRLGLAERTVVHGFRSSFRTYALEQTEVPWEVCEAALAHEFRSQVARSYARSDLLERRRPLMQLWSSFLTECELE